MPTVWTSLKDRLIVRGRYVGNSLSGADILRGDGKDGTASDNGDNEPAAQSICPSCAYIFVVASRILKIGDRAARVWTHSASSPAGSIRRLLAHNLSLFSRIDVVNIGDQSAVLYKPSRAYTSK